MRRFGNWGRGNTASASGLPIVRPLVRTRMGRGRPFPGGGAAEVREGFQQGGPGLVFRQGMEFVQAPGRFGATTGGRALAQLGHPLPMFPQGGGRRRSAALGNHRDHPPILFRNHRQGLQGRVEGGLSIGGWTGALQRRNASRGHGPGGVTATALIPPEGGAGDGQHQGA